MFRSNEADPTPENEPSETPHYPESERLATRPSAAPDPNDPNPPAPPPTRPAKETGAGFGSFG